MRADVEERVKGSGGRQCRRRQGSGRHRPRRRQLRSRYLPQGRQGGLRDDRHGLRRGQPQDAQGSARAATSTTGFAGAITDRESRGEQVDQSFVGIKSADIVEAEVKNGMAQVTVKFVSELISATRDKAGEVITGDPEAHQGSDGHLDVCARGRLARSELEADRHAGRQLAGTGGAPARRRLATGGLRLAVARRAFGVLLPLVCGRCARR